MLDVSPADHSETAKCSSRARARTVAGCRRSIASSERNRRPRRARAGSSRRYLLCRNRTDSARCRHRVSRAGRYVYCVRAVQSDGPTGTPGGFGAWFGFVRVMTGQRDHNAECGQDEERPGRGCRVSSGPAGMLRVVVEHRPGRVGKREGAGKCVEVAVIRAEVDDAVWDNRRAGPDVPSRCRAPRVGCRLGQGRRTCRHRSRR